MTPRQVATVFPIPCEKGAPEGETWLGFCFDEECLTASVRRSIKDFGIWRLDVERCSLDVLFLKNEFLHSRAFSRSNDQIARIT